MNKSRDIQLKLGSLEKGPSPSHAILKKSDVAFFVDCRLQCVSKQNEWSEEAKQNEWSGETNNRLVFIT